MSEQEGTVPEAVEQEIGEEYVESQEDVQDNSEEKIEETQPQEEVPRDETVAERKKRTKEELIDLAEEFYGVKKDEVVIDKNGDLKLVVKINGKKRLVSPKKDILKGFNLNQAGYEKLNEGKQLIKQVQGFFDEAKSNPVKLWEMADNLGIDKYELARRLLEDKVSEMSMTDEERRFKELEKREEEFKRREEEDKKKHETAQQEQAKQVEMQRYDQELTSAMTEMGFQKASKGQKSHILMGAIGELMVANRAGRDMTCKDAVMRAVNKWQDYVHGVFDDIDDDHIIKIIPERIIKAIRKADLGKIGVGMPTSNARPESHDQQIELPEVDSRPRRKKQVSLSDYFSNLN